MFGSSSVSTQTKPHFLSVYNTNQSSDGHTYPPGEALLRHVAAPRLLCQLAPQPLQLAQHLLLQLAYNTTHSKTFSTFTVTTVLCASSQSSKQGAYVSCVLATQQVTLPAGRALRRNPQSTTHQDESSKRLIQDKSSTFPPVLSTMTRSCNADITWSCESGP
jgi:hypothetical protein